MNLQLYSRACRAYFRGGDPQDATLCGGERCYRTRLRPRPRLKDAEQAVSCLVNGGEARISSDLAEQLRLHDELACSWR